jgi:hypothetical protein
MLLAAALLLTPPPTLQPAVTIVATARARILSAVRVTRSGSVAGVEADRVPLITQQRPRRDGAIVVDCF